MDEINVRLSKLCGIVVNFPESIEVNPDLMSDVFLFLSGAAKELDSGRAAMNKTKTIFESKLGLYIDANWEKLPATDAGPYFERAGRRFRAKPDMFVNVPSRKDPEARKKFFDELSKDPRFSKFMVREVQDKPLNLLVQTIMSEGEIGDLPECLRDRVSIHSNVKVHKGGQDSDGESEANT